MVPGGPQHFAGRRRLCRCRSTLPADIGVLGWIGVVCGIASLMLLIAGAEQLNDNWTYLAAADEQHYVLHPPHAHEHGEDHH
jgi:hypothetical protein